MAVREGERTLLGNGDAARHDHEDLPVVLADRGGGTIDRGRHVRYPRGTPLMSRVLCMLDGIGVAIERFGDRTGQLPDLTL